MNIYVGNLSYDTDDASLRSAFEQHGAVDDARVIQDKYTGRSRGFGFVEMPNDSEAKTAIERMEGANLDGRPLRVNEARPRESGGRGDRDRRR
ncbi:MAG TPA: RNA-binding protein [Candidatus Hydrogenedentes bacterium]|nr:RNA-binding protein [Candidatus Hydrogenedentota bacterium]